MLFVDLVSFVALLIISISIRQRLARHGHPATSIGGPVMSLGVFTAFALPRLPFYSITLGRIVTIEVFVIWLIIAWSFLKSYLNHSFHLYYENYLQRFAIGTWVAGTAVLAILITRTLPEAIWLSRTLAIAAVVIYLSYLMVFVRGYIELWRRPLHQHANGIILLATVATQSVVIALNAAFGGGVPANLLLGMIVFDAIFLLSGLALVFLHYHRLREEYLASRWKNTNCIIHGAVSISGLALILTSNFNNGFILGFWLVDLLIFVIIEGVELLRLFQRLHRYGLIKAALTYDVSQWTRNFTFGMLYAFSLELLIHIGSYAGFWYPLLKVICSYGQYVVFALLLIEISLFLQARIIYRRPE